MLKLLLGHWQSHREPLPFVLTDDPLYCSYLTKSPFPEVYSVNRINPIFEEDEGLPDSLFNRQEIEKSSLQLKKTQERLSALRTPSDQKHQHLTLKPSISDPRPNSIDLTRDPKITFQRSISDQRTESDTSSIHLEVASDPIKIPFQRSISDQRPESDTSSLKRSISEERREAETRASDDTGYSSSDHLKSVTSDAGSLEARHMSSDSDDYSQPEALVVSVDVHRVSYPEDVIVLPSSNSSSRSQTYSANSYFAGSSSNSSQEPFDSLTMSNDHAVLETTEVKRPNAIVREKLQKLLDKGTDRNTEMFLDSLDERTISVSNNQDMEKTKMDLMKSLTRALNNKVPTHDGSSPTNPEVITRTDSALEDRSVSQPKSLDRKSTTSSTSPKTLYFTNKSDSNGVTRQDESSASSSISFAKPRKYQRTKHAEKESKRGSTGSTQESSDSKKSHKCKLCENAKRPLAFHQLLPGHWSYDNVYLPQLSGACCSCMHHNPSFLPQSDDDYPFYHSQDIARARHSWAPYTNSRGFSENPSKRRKDSDDKSASTNSHKEHSNRYSPDGSSRETDSSRTESSRLKKSLTERRSLREPKKCRCEYCLASVLDKTKTHPPHLESHVCPCHCLSDRRVKFASDTDVSQHKHMHSIPIRLGKNGAKLTNAALVMNLPHLNGHVLKNSQAAKENGLDSKKSPELIPRGLKEPIKMDDLYRSYPVNFRDWEAHYRRDFLKKRRRRALNMVGMAIGIVFVVGIAVALTFVFLRIRRPA